MFKDLKSAIKSFMPTDRDLSIITNNFLKHNFIHSGDNLFGEKYEAWVYEYLKFWALNSQDVSYFVIKNSPIPSVKKNGLTYDKNGQIIYVLNGRIMAEYDGLFVYKKKIVFVEASVSELRSYYRKLEDRVIKKRHLLVNLFGTEEVYFLLVTRPRKRSMVYRSNPNLVLFTLKDPAFDNLVSNDLHLKAEDSKLVSIDRLCEEDYTNKSNPL